MSLGIGHLPRHGEWTKEKTELFLRAARIIGLTVPNPHTYTRQKQPVGVVNVKAFWNIAVSLPVCEIRFRTVTAVRRFQRILRFLY